MIESPHNSIFKKLLSLTTSNGLKEEGLFLLSGKKLIDEFLRNPHLEIIYEIITPHLFPVTTGIEQLQIKTTLFSQLDILGTHFNILVIKQPSLPILSAIDLRSYLPKGIELVLPLGDPGNLGALIRSCEAFGVPRVILSREAAHPFLPKSVKASAGSVLRVPLARGPSLSDFPLSSIALDQRGTAINDFVWPKQGLLVVGEEGPGLNTTQFTTRIRIPTAGVESLNVVVAASIALSQIPH